MTERTLNPFGVTNPCVNIARHFGLPQDFVDATMEVQLTTRGIRPHIPYHIRNYLREDHVVEEIAMAALDAIDGVIDDMKALASPVPAAPAS